MIFQQVLIIISQNNLLIALKKEILSSKNFFKKHSFSVTEIERKFTNVENAIDELVSKKAVETKQNEIESENEVIKKRLMSDDVNDRNNIQNDGEGSKKQKKQKKKFYGLVDKIYENFAEFTPHNKPRTDSIVSFF